LRDLAFVIMMFIILFSLSYILCCTVCWLSWCCRMFVFF